MSSWFESSRHCPRNVCVSAVDHLSCSDSIPHHPGHCPGPSLLRRLHMQPRSSSSFSTTSWSRRSLLELHLLVFPVVIPLRDVALLLLNIVCPPPSHGMGFALRDECAELFIRSIMSLLSFDPARDKGWISVGMSCCIPWLV